jgi:hypothetical protein
MSRQGAFSLSAGLVLAVLFSLGTMGCNGSQSESEAIKKALEVNNKSAETVVKFSGTVTVDGQPPAVDRRNPFFVIAYDPKNPPKGRQAPFTTRCDKEGHFQFNTYGTGDGLPAGSYVALFVQPKADGDALKNLYNDPDKNDKEERFQINLTPPGKTNWSFELTVAGKEPNTTPGEHAVMADRGKKKNAG